MLMRIKQPFLMPKRLFMLALLIALIGFQQSAGSWAVNSPASGVRQRQEIALTQVVRLVESVHFGERKLGKQTLDEFADRLPVNARFQKRAGVFVTLSRNGKTRACWGTIFPQQKSIVEETVFSTIGALTKEYRYPAVQASEWKGLKPQVTVIRSVDPINNIRFQNALRDGLLVRAGGKSGVFLPGEAVDAYYQLVQCKLKAGIAPGEPCQLYRLRTEIYE
jgi:AMMECR1 domain-containing protein